MVRAYFGAKEMIIPRPTTHHDILPSGVDVGVHLLWPKCFLCLATLLELHPHSHPYTVKIWLFVSLCPLGSLGMDSDVSSFEEYLLCRLAQLTAQENPQSVLLTYHSSSS